MLTQTAGQPLYGKISDLVGRKVHLSLLCFKRVLRLMVSQIVLYTCMFIFTLGSLLCGMAKVCHSPFS
jgi:MFS family permease